MTRWISKTDSKEAATTVTNRSSRNQLEEHATSRRSHVCVRFYDILNAAHALTLFCLPMHIYLSGSPYACVLSDKGKGRAEPSGSSSATAPTSTVVASSSSSSVRRAPVGKVIHYFADSPNQGYDGAAFSDAYQKHVLRLNEEQELANTKRTVEDQKREEQIAAIKEEDVDILVRGQPLSTDPSRLMKARADQANRLEEGGGTAAISASRQQQARRRM